MNEKRNKNILLFVSSEQILEIQINVFLFMYGVQNCLRIVKKLGRAVRQENSYRGGLGFKQALFK